MLELEIEAASANGQGRPSLDPVSMRRGGPPRRWSGPSSSRKAIRSGTACASLARVTSPAHADSRGGPRGARRGGAAWLLLLTLALVAGLAIFLFATTRGEDEKVRPRGGASAAPTAGSSRGDAPPAKGSGEVDAAPGIEAPRMPSAPADDGADPEDLRLRVDALRDAQSDEQRFDGRGKIRGYIETADETPFPTEWSLVLEPSTTLIGRERAVRRVIEFTQGEQEFEIDDLPLAGYDVLAKAPGWNARRHSVLLDNRHRNPYITMQFYAAGFLEGRVLNHEKLPAEGLPVTLRWLGGSDEPRTTETDVLGRFRFDEVLDGEYELRFGAALAPLLEPKRVRFTAPHMTLPDRELPVTSNASIVALDPYGNPIPDVRVRGSGSNGSAFDVVTDATGRATARFLKPGRYRASGDHEHYRRARHAFEVGDEPVDVVLRLDPLY